MPDPEFVAPLPQEILRRKRMGHSLTTADLQAVSSGLSNGRWGDAQAGAFAMAVCTMGMTVDEIVALTLAMRDSGRRLDWSELDGPVLDKHSTGGVGDLVSLVLAPMLAACGAFVPMLSGRGLGHTGGTLDKLESIPGYQIQPDLNRLRQVVRDTGLAIVGAGIELAPADQRLYAIRDITGTVESIALITASILSKKLAAATDALILDIKTGNGAAMTGLEQARALAHSLVDVATQAELPTRALITDMQQPLAPDIGNALELHCALAYLRGDKQPDRLHAVTLRLGSELLCLAGLASDRDAAELKLLHSLNQGTAAEHFARMVAALGGPADLLDSAGSALAKATCIRPVFAQRNGVVQSIDTRRLGMTVVGLGGGRTQPQQRIDHAVGLSEVAELGTQIDAERPLALIHARDADSFEHAAVEVRAAYTLADEPAVIPPLIHELICSKEY